MWYLLLSPVQVERNLHDAMEVARNILVEPYLLPGGGAAEMALAQVSQPFSHFTLAPPFSLQPLTLHPLNSLTPPSLLDPPREGQECSWRPAVALPCCGKGPRGDPSDAHTELRRQLHSCSHCTQGEWIEQHGEGEGRGRGWGRGKGRVPDSVCIGTTLPVQAKHATPGNTAWGVDGERGVIADMNQLGVWDPLAVKVQTYKSAIEVSTHRSTAQAER